MGKSDAKVVRTYDDEAVFITQRDASSFEIKVGMVDNMLVPGRFYANDRLRELVYEELRDFAQAQSTGCGGFLPAAKQIANVAALPGIVKASIALPDVHSGYGFAIGNVAAFDMDDPNAVVSPGGVGFDINCGVRLIRTNLHEDDLADKRELLAQTLFDHIPVGVGSKGVIPTSSKDRLPFIWVRYRTDLEIGSDNFLIILPDQTKMPAAVDVEEYLEVVQRAVGDWIYLMCNAFIVGHFFASPGWKHKRTEDEVES